MTAPEKEIAKCPACGHDAEVTAVLGVYRSSRVVACSGCPLLLAVACSDCGMMLDQEGGKSTEAEAIDEWNHQVQVYRDWQQKAKEEAAAREKT